MVIKSVTINEYFSASSTRNKEGSIILSSYSDTESSDHLAGHHNLGSFNAIITIPAVEAILTDFSNIPKHANQSMNLN